MFQQFMAYCASENDKGAKWFLIPLVTLSGLIMPVVIFIMTYFSLPGFLPYVALSVLLLIAVLILNIAKYSTTIIIPVYFVTILINLLYPLVSWVLKIG